MIDNKRIIIITISGRSEKFPAPGVGDKNSGKNAEILYNEKYRSYDCTICQSSYTNFTDAQFCYRLCRIEKEFEK